MEPWLIAMFELQATGSPIGLTMSDLLTFVVSFSALVVATGSLVFSRRQQTREYGLQSMMQIHELLGNPSARDARKDLFETYRKYRMENDISVYAAHEHSVSQVKGDFEIISSMLRKHLVPEDTLLEVYRELIIICWKAVEPKVRDEREKRGYKHYFEGFESLAKVAERYSADVVGESVPELI
jgi:hypothetical protein